MPGLNELAEKPYDAGTRFSDRVHFVHVYVVEPHPMAPDPAPHVGVVAEDPRFSTVRQPRTYEGRMVNAALVRPLIVGNQIQVMDALDPNGLINPVWCTYGTSPNATYLIGRDGIIRLASTWTGTVDLEAAIRSLLAE
ncbi:MAG TPA: hypothetical protein VFX92_03935 [Candidatus Krumholzibacteria bacterium]|nr:hypothetical protein [Candidatus Krumholzibacteria bacterium]